jgi:hypothetical protein
LTGPDKSIITPFVNPEARSWSRLAFRCAAAAGLAVYVATLIRTGRSTILDHSVDLFGPNFFLLPGLWIAAWAGLTLVVNALEKERAGAFPATPEHRKNPAAWLWPLIVLLVAPFLASDYFNRDDLRRRLVLLGLFVAAAVVYLYWTDAVSRSRTRRGWPGRVYNRFLRLPVKKRLLILFIAAFLVYNACALVLVLEGVTFAGDEPNYLMTTHSLAADGDINLANNFADRDYFHFYDREENPGLRMSPYARAGIKGRDYVYPINLPGISVLMVPFYALSQAVEGVARTFILKGSLAIWAVLLGLQLYLLARDLWRREGLALGLWALYAFSTPVLFYAVHLYPEIPIALFSIYVYRMARSKRPVSTLRLVFMGALLGTFFWFGVKYNLIFWPVLLTALYYLWPSVKPRIKLVGLVLPALAGMALFYFAVWTWYGTFSPFAVYEGVLAPGQAQAITQSFLDLPISSRIETFLDYFLDQRDGLILYAPFWAFMFLGLIEMVRRGREIRRDLLGLLLIAGPFVLNYAFFTHRQGFCPQARVLAPISWIGMVALGYFLERRGKRIFEWLFGLGVAAAGGISWILLRHPSFLTQPTTHDYTTRAGDLFVYLSNIRFSLPPLLPSFIKVDNAAYGPNYLWAGLLALLIIAYLLFGKANPKPLPDGFHGLAAAVILGGCFFLWVLPPRVPLYPSWTVRYSTGGSIGFYMMPMGRGVIAKNEGEMYLHFEKNYRFVFASREKLEKIKLTYGSAKGEHEIRINFFDTPLLEARTSREIKETVFGPGAAYRLRDLFIYEVVVTLKKFSDENLLVDPYLLRISPGR